MYCTPYVQCMRMYTAYGQYVRDLTTCAQLEVQFIVESPEPFSFELFFLLFVVDMDTPNTHRNIC